MKNKTVKKRQKSKAKLDAKFKRIMKYLNEFDFDSEFDKIVLMDDIESIINE